MKIAIDIGHANGTGARGNGLEEHALAKDIVSYLEPMLEAKGYESDVIDFPEMSNSDDLNATIRAANSGSYSIGVSIHCDCSDNQKARGAHVCYISSAGKHLAESIADHICKHIPGRADRTVKRDNLAVLKQTKPVWVLVECGFISNRDDADALNDPYAIARWIADGIQDYENLR